MGLLTTECTIVLMCVYPLHVAALIERQHRENDLFSVVTYTHELFKPTN